MSLLRGLRLFLLNNLDCNFLTGDFEFNPTGKLEWIFKTGDNVTHISGYFEILILWML